MEFRRSPDARAVASRAARRFHALAIAHACSIFASSAGIAGTTPEFRMIARDGQAFPGREGAVYAAYGSTPFIGAKSDDPNGDVYFRADAKLADGSEATDILVYRHATGVVAPYVRSGETVAGSPMRVFWGTVGGAQVGITSLIGLLEDGTPGDAMSVLVAKPGGERQIMAREGQQAPGYTSPATLIDPGTASGAFLDVNMNNAGDVSWGATFRDSSNILRHGYYLTRADGRQERIVDSTMAVPNRAGASWVAYDGIGAPFDIYTPGLDGEANAYFKAKYRMNGKDYRAFYKRTSDGSLTPIVDTADPNAVPGMPGYSFGRLRASVNNQRGDVAFTGEIIKPDGSSFGAGVFAAHSGGALAKVLAFGDDVPGIPEAMRNASPGLMAMSSAGHILVTANYFLDYPTGRLGGQSLLLYGPDGVGKPILKFNETPGFPGERAGLCGSADINSRGDTLFVTRMNISQDTYAAFAYLNDTGELVPILKTGDTLEGLKVVSFDFGGGATEPLGSIGASGGPVFWDDNRDLSLNVILKDATGHQTSVLYAVRVPAPGASAVLLVATPWWSTRRRSGPDAT